MRVSGTLILTAAVLLCSIAVNAQQTNPVERQVSNPITDTPNINPVSAQENVAPKPRRSGLAPEGGDGELVVYSDRQEVEGEEGKRVLRHIGNVDVRVTVRLTCGARCPTVRVGDYVEVDGEKVHEQLNEAESVTVVR